MNLANIEYQDKLRQYVLQMRPVFKPNALFSDETANYVTPMEPDPGDIVTIRFRTWKDNVDKVYLVSNDRHLAMEYEKSEGDFDYFKIRLVMQEESVRYFFEIHAGKIRCFYNKIGVSRDRLDVYDFTIAPGFHTPEWAKGAVMYQIFVDRFSSGDTNNTVEDCEYYYIGDYSRKVTDWRKNPSFMGVREFYGGDLQGVMNKLDYLQDLGVDVIYFNPIFVSPSNHKYDIQDYDYIDPHYGKIVSDGGETLKDGDTINAHASKYIKRVTDKANLESSNTFFVQLVEEIHRRGMKVILDGVFNHCGSFNKWMDRERIYENAEGYDKGAYVSADVMKNRLKMYIDEVMTHFEEKYPGAIYCWDVVNEAVADNAGEFADDDVRHVRQVRGGKTNLFYDYIGSDYVELAFRYAYETRAKLQAANSKTNIKLFYNDYNTFATYGANKRDAIIQLVKSVNSFASDGNGGYLKLCDGIGMQSYIGGYGQQSGCMNDNDITLVKNAIEKFAENNVEVHVTELAVRNYDNDAEPEHAAFYKKLVQTYVDINKAAQAAGKTGPITSLSIWGLFDAPYLSTADYSYKMNGPYCGLFTELYQPKQSFKEVYEVLAAE